MKTVKLVTLILSGFLFVQLQAQDANGNVKKTEEKKVIIIKKTIDENGKEVTEKIVKEGDDVDNIFFLDENGKKVEINIESITEDDGKTMKWTSKDGKDIKVITKSQTIEIDDDGEDKSIRIKMSGEGEADVFKWNGEGDIPESIKKELAAEGIDLDKTDKEIRIVKIGNPNQAFLGVQMAITQEIKNENGVETATKDDSSKIVGIIPNSAAEEAGLQEGDVITAIDGTTITSQKDVIDALGNYKKGDKITIIYTRDGKSKKTKATLKGHSENDSMTEEGFENKNVEVSVEEDAEGNVITTTTTTITKNGEKTVTKEVKKTKKD